MIFHTNRLQLQIANIPYKQITITDTGYSKYTDFKYRYRVFQTYRLKLQKQDIPNAQITNRDTGYSKLKDTKTDTEY